MNSLLPCLKIENNLTKEFFRMSILFFSTRYPKPLKDSIEKSIVFSDSASAVVFSDAIFHGLAECGLSFININIPPVGHWPKMNKKFRMQTEFCIEQGCDVWNVGTTNLYAYQYFSVYKQTYRTIKKVLNGESAICLVYAIEVPIIKAILRYRRNYAPKLRIILIIPDLIEDIYSGHTLKSRVQRWMHGDIDLLYRQMDGFVYLTEQMRDKTKSNKPYCVVEGIFDQISEEYFAPDFDNIEKVVFYSGKLEKRFGVRRLVDAFCLIPDDNVRLVLCGSGDCVDYIKQRSTTDNRVLFKGQISREEVLRLQSKARLLVNPRAPEGEYTRYSFPSKNIQYLASGIPTLIYRLEGIPDEYYSYCLTVEGDYLSVEDLSRSIQSALKLSPEECFQLGNAARRFILENKIARIQGKKIIDLISAIQ